METRFRDTDPELVKADLLVVPVRENRLEESGMRALDRRLKGTLRERIQKSRFAGAEGSVLLHATARLLPAAHILLVGLGKEAEISGDIWRKAGARAAKEAAGVGAETVGFLFSPDRDPEVAAGAVVEGLLLAGYQFGKYRSNSKPPHAIKTLTLFRRGLSGKTALERAIAKIEAMVPGVFLARDLVNEPPSVTTADFLAREAQRHGHGRGLSVEVWNKNKIEAMSLAGLLAVNRGSHEEPRFIVMRYRPRAKARKRVILIGKGITFDSGGLSLKPAKSMETMKLDMAGGAAVIATMSRLPDLDLPVEVTGYIPATDNLPGANAQKPGDIIRYLNGKTVEVLNTDAEGRLILADALALAAREKPDYTITLATLTGACVVALGAEVAGLFSNHQPLAEQLLHCAAASGEKLWQLPLVKEYRDLIRSSVADLKNVGGAHGGAITAALILQEFIGDLPWAHLDIAGPAFSENDTGAAPKGGTGFGVRTLLRFLSSL